jgi:phosphate starvation-inducible PhoH-like protein
LAESKVEIRDNRKAAVLFGAGDENLHYLQGICEAEISARGADIFISGEEQAVDYAFQLIQDLMVIVEAEEFLSINDITYMDKLLKKGDRPGYQDIVSGTLVTTSHGKAIKARTIGQKRYVESILRDDVVFGIGPAGTGKTYLAVVMAVRALRNKEVERIILVRQQLKRVRNWDFCPVILLKRLIRI